MNSAAETPTQYDTVVISHSWCPDGTAAAWMFTRPEAKYLGSIYFHFTGERDWAKDTKCPNLTGTDVIIVDYSYPADQLNQIAEIAKSVIVLDHHLSAKDLADDKTLSSHIMVKIDMTKCGAELACEFLNMAAPWWLNHIADRDLWRWTYPNSKEFGTAFHNEGLSLETLDKFAAMNPQEVYDIGVKYIQHDELEVSRLAKGARLSKFFDGKGREYQIYLVESRLYRSELGNYLALKPEVDFAAIYVHDIEAQSFNISLRSVKDKTEANMAEIAKGFGGGGHAQAAGFQFPVGDFNNYFELVKK